MRECGECTLCCLVTEIPELSKPINVMCNFCDQGCTIHAERPKSCRNYNCAWLLGAMDEDMRPDKCHVVIEPLPDESVVLALIEPGYEESLVDLDLSEFTKRGASIVASDGRALFCEGADHKSVQKVLNDSAQLFGMI